MSQEQIRLIDENGKQLGLFSYQEALNLARQKNLDLFLITNKVVPPVYRLGEASKLKYKQEKQLRKKRAKEKLNLPKTIRLGFNEAVHDLEIKAKKTTQLLNKGRIITLQLKLMGREKQHFDLAQEKLNYFLSLLPISYKIIQPLKKTPFGFAISLKKGD